ncbi:TIGR03560 family F420-dependent LLM class oxidoreductase [Dactylosporangium vinaceum]|uniref:TIGR03560 family F420-dependent LLM class oxidoreductase n=1 Tax=Dactylosporangium vinaceum TaxID=53362 RepID=A0ABV5M395_9ACTN|nr:TIGR03560 family F420-dependent LLM class oxidoreductase [Dactylosporangium vinaceum]UAB99746.1 TIGR03560 family F420-dependent LLM class oxidoreductase [Dactylosporangium vinaceum]
MDFRITVEPQQGAEYADVLRAARSAGAAGYEAFFTSDHLLAMADPDVRHSPLDAWTTMAGLARETSTLRLGTLVTASTLRRPGPLAVTVAQVDRMSGGRVELGIGTGWYQAEHDAYGVPFPAFTERFDRLTEQLAILTGMWATPPGAEYSFTGEHYELTRAAGRPRPAQSPTLPIIIGGTGPRRTPQLAARYAAEYNANYTSLDAAVAAYRRADDACRATGRDPATLIHSAALTLAVGRTDTEVARRTPALGPHFAAMVRRGVTGSPARAVDVLGRWSERTGCTRFYLQLFDVTDIDQLELVASDVIPQLRRGAAARA